MRKICPEDLLKMKFIRSVCVSPDEKKIMFTVEIIAEDKKKYHSHIHMIDSDGSNLRQYTFGDVSDSPPVFSPDGRWIVFTSKRGEKKGIYKMPADGGEAKLLVDADGSFTDISVSPDNKQILCVFKKADEVPKDKDGKKEEPVYRHITRKFYKLDNAGFMPQDRGHVYIYDMETGKGRQITNGKNGEYCPVFFPDGKKIAYISNIQRDPDEDALRDDIFVVAVSGGKARKLNKPAGPAVGLSISPDGKRIAYIGHDEPDDAWDVASFAVWTIPVTGGTAQNLTGYLDRPSIDETISDTAEDHEMVRPVWSKDGKKLYFMLSDSGSSHIMKISSNGGKASAVISGKLHVMAASLRTGGKMIASIISTPTKIAELHISPLHGKPKQLTHLNKEFDEIAIQKPEEIIIRSDDGYPIHGWILKPPGFSPKKKYPSILEIHGGPRAQYGNTFFHEMQFLAAKGYVVYYSNPRGGQGYGRKHAESIVNAWGTVDYDDCMALAYYMAEQPYIDCRKMGVTGGSYGGYMTNWIVGHTNLFAAAVTQRSVVNFISFYGASDIGFALDREIKGNPWDNLDSWWEMSPIKHVVNIRTPLLISHSEQDLRCPIEQGEQLFIALKKLGRTVEMIRFPEEPHGLSRCGRPDRRIARLEWIAKWFDKYLKGK